MKIFFSVIFALLVATLGVTVLPIVFHVEPTDAYILGLYALVVMMGERGALASAISFGAVADLWSALPFGTFLILFPTLLGAWHLLGVLVFTNRSLITHLALVAFGTMWIHGLGFIFQLFIASFSRDALLAPSSVGTFAMDLFLSMLTNVVLASLSILLMRAITTRYSARFLRRGKF